MTEIVLDWSKHILVIDGVEYKYFEINWGYRDDISLCDIYILDGDSVITGIVKSRDIIYIND